MYLQIRSKVIFNYPFQIIMPHFFSERPLFFSEKKLFCHFRTLYSVFSYS